MLLWLYSLLYGFSLPLQLLRLVWRAQREPTYARNWAERCGLYANTPPVHTTLCFWIHAVSVGETRAALPLISALQQRYPQARFILTHHTPAGRAVACGALQQQLGARLQRCYAPFDLKWFVARFLRHYSVSHLLLMETEVWPNWLHTCRQQAIPVILINARLSAQSLRKGERWRSLFSSVSGAFTLICAQTPHDARRWRRWVSCPVVICGNLKFDEPIAASSRELGRTWRHAAGQLQIICLASSREGEEIQLLKALHALQLHPQRTSLRFLIVPRHPVRSATITQDCLRLGYQPLFRSSWPLDLQSTSALTSLMQDHLIWIGDSMGEMAAYYTLADEVLMGGSFEAFGSQNLIEAIGCGKTVQVGPHTYNFAAITQAAIKSGLAQQHATIAQALTFVLADRNRPQLTIDLPRDDSLSFAAQQFMAHHQGATARTLLHLTSKVPKLQ